MIKQNKTKVLAFSLLIVLGGTLNANKKSINCALNCICQKVNTLTLCCDSLSQKANRIIACACTCQNITYIKQSMVPYTITKSGTYVLCEDINVANEAAFTIASPNVSFDLAGKTIAAQTGIEIGTGGAPAYNVHIFNGTITNAQDIGADSYGYAIRTNNTNDRNILLDNLLVTDCISNNLTPADTGLVFDFNGVHDVFVRDCKITHNESEYRPVIACRDCANVVFDGCQIADNTYSTLISLDTSSQIVLQNSEILGNLGFPLSDAVDQINYVLYMNDTTASSISNCKFIANCPAKNMNSYIILIDSVDKEQQYNSIMNCQLIDNMTTDSTGPIVFGIDIESSYNHIENCLINGISGLHDGADVKGINCVASSYNIIEKCMIELIKATGAGASAMGIAVNGLSDYNDVEDCIVQHITCTGQDNLGSYGIAVETLNNNMVVRNKVLDYGVTVNDYGLYLDKFPAFLTHIGAVIGNTVGVGYQDLTSPATYNNYHYIYRIAESPEGQRWSDGAHEIVGPATNLALTVTSPYVL